MLFWLAPLLWHVVSALAAIVSIFVGLLTWQLMQQVYLCDRVKPESAPPDELIDFFERTMAPLVAQQFQLAGYYTVETIQGTVQWAALLHDEAQRIYAVIIPSNTAIDSASISFTTVFEGDIRLTSVNERLYGIFSSAPKNIIQSHHLTTSTQLLAMHQQSIADLARTTPFLSLSPQAYTENYNAYILKEAERWVQQKEVSWVTPQVLYRMRFGAALQGAVKLLWGMAAGAFSQPASVDSSAEPSDAAAEQEYTAFQQFQQPTTQPVSRRKRLWLFWVTLGCFVAVYATHMTPISLIIFVAVLMLHEGGHLLAMKLFGYRQGGVLFVPFLGALATARKDNASLSEKVWISLAGPLPGIVIALLFSIGVTQGWLPTSPWTTEAISILIGLNLFNLLPVYPLDGGQVADLLVFSRYPYLGLVFKLFGIVALLLLALMVQAPLLIAFALLIGITIPSTFRLAKVNRQLHQSLAHQVNPAISSEETAKLAFQQMQQSAYRQLTTQQKHTLVKGILDSRRELAAPLSSRLGLSVVYLGSLVLGLGLGFRALWLLPGDENFAESDVADAELASGIPAATPYLCPTDSPSAASSTDMAVADGTGLMQERQRTVIATFDTADQAQQALTSVQPQLGATDAAQLLANTLFVSTFDRTASDRWSATLASTATQVLIQDAVDGLQPSLRITATATDQQHMQQTADELSNFFELTYSFTNLVPPWSVEPALTPDQVRARHTYVTLMTAQQESYEDSGSVGFNLFWSIAGALTGNQRWIAAAGENWQLKANQAAQEAAQTLSESKDADTDTIDLFLQELGLQQQQMSAVYDRYDGLNEENSLADYEAAHERYQTALAETNTKIAQRLGAIAPSQTSNISDGYDSIGNWISGEVYHTGDQLSIDYLISSQPRTLLPEITQYLCNGEFTDIRYEFVEPAEYAAAEDF